MRGGTLNHERSTVRTTGWACLALLLFGIPPLDARAQAPQPASPAPGTAAADDAEWRRQMESRVQQLERENQQLRSEVADIAHTQQSVMEDAQKHGIITFVEGGQPRLTTPDFFDINKFAAEGDFPGSVRLPGSNTSFQLGGYVQLDAIFDSDRIGNEDSFAVSTIQTGGEKTGAGNTNFSVRQTRLFLKTQTPTQEWGDLVTYIEIDFLGTDGTEPRLRHAYGQIGNTNQLLAGQTWSAFQDATVFPATLDSQGPPGIINNRRPQVRYRHDWAGGWTGVVALEDPTADITTPAGLAGEESTPYPDLAGNIRWAPDWGHVQLAGVLRYLQFDPDQGSRESDVGYGLSLTGSLKTIHLDDKHVDTVLYQIAGGNGIARYVNDINGQGLDAVLPAAGEDLDGLSVFAGLIGYQHWWSAKWGSTLCYSLVDVNVTNDLPDTTYHNGQYVVVNLRYYPAERVMLGGEVLYGRRKDKGGDDGDDVRVQFSAQYRF